MQADSLPAELPGKPHRVPGRINPRIHTMRHTAIKMVKIKDKDKILKATREFPSVIS